MLVPASAHRGCQHQLEMKKVAAAFNYNYESQNWCWRDIWLIMHELMLRRLGIHITTRLEILKINRHKKKPCSCVACSVTVEARSHGGQNKNGVVTGHASTGIKQLEEKFLCVCVSLWTFVVCEILVLRLQSCHFSSGLCSVTSVLLVHSHPLLLKSCN